MNTDTETSLSFKISKARSLKQLTFMIGSEHYSPNYIISQVSKYAFN